MKLRHLVTSVAAALVAGGASFSALAADTQNLTVTATVLGTCKFSGTAQTLTIANSGANIDPSIATAASGTASVLYRCTNGTASTGVTAGAGLYAFGGSNRVSNGAATPAYMNYSLTLTGGTQTGTGFGAGNDKTLTVTGLIAVAQFQNASAGTYNDTVVLTIAP